ncbi:MAG TPA: hypothetical protein VK700_15150 [Steroidobacteraceae bacterium]|jgi:hypothetical protein|nr:hypothetical protein [Steroidobacteraceae bacterium]
MTIRDHFKRTQMWCTYGLAAILIGTALGIRFLHPKLPRPDILMVGLGLAAVAIVAVYFVTRRIYRCPRCGVGLNQLRAQTIGGQNKDRRMFWEIWNACPNCQLSFDAPWPK